MKYTILALALTLVSSSVFSKGRPLLRCPKKDNKALVCHVPPGNPSNAKEIFIAKDAVEDHLAHGDYTGYCKDTNYEAKKEMCGICDADIDPNC
ncbi:hypothetical protein [Halobacteriovorax sp.]|uniref:hypothetical protein n=1 Tax=Halobacteriovorax sp. TaxID=2020862 RepID=UPI003AF3000E